MAKAVLVMDMPENCLKCSIGQNMSNVMENCIHCPIINKCAVGEETEKRHEDCPLVELPEKILEPEGFESVETSVKRVGWNALLDKITAEGD